MNVFGEYTIWTGLMQEEAEVHHFEFSFSLPLLNLLWIHEGFAPSLL
jgi:hypothetical protein